LAARLSEPYESGLRNCGKEQIKRFVAPNYFAAAFSVSSVMKFDSKAE